MAIFGSKMSWFMIGTIAEVEHGVVDARGNYVGRIQPVGSHYHSVQVADLIGTGQNADVTARMASQPNSLTFDTGLNYRERRMQLNRPVRQHAVTRLQATGVQQEQNIDVEVWVDYPGGKVTSRGGIKVGV